MQIVHHALLTGNQSLLDQVAEHPSWRHIRIIMSTQETTAFPVDIGLGLQASDLVIPTVRGSFLNLVSGKVLCRHVQGDGGAVIALDHSISFDSNLAELLRIIFNGKTVNPVDFSRVVGVLRLKARNKAVQFDLEPFLLENVRHARRDSKNLRPLNTIVAFRMIDYLKWDMLLREVPEIEFTEPRELLSARLEVDANAYLLGLFEDVKYLAHEKQVLGIEALLLRLARLWHLQPKEKDLRAIFRELVDFSLSELPAVPQTELSIIWSGLSPSPSDFFAPVVTDNINGRPIKISGMAWDIGHLRRLERYVRGHGAADFTVSHFATNDAGWRSKFQLNPICHVVIDDEKKSALFIREREAGFQTFLNECLSERARAEFAPEKIEARRRRVHRVPLAQAKAVLQGEREKFARKFPQLVTGEWPQLPPG